MPLQEPWNSLREFASIALLLGVVVWGLWNARRRLQPWYLVAWGGAAVVSLPITLYLVTEARSGSFQGWGGLGMVMILLPAAFIAALSVTALLTLAVLVPLYGFDRRPADVRRAEREAERQRRRDPAAIRAKAIRDLKIYALVLAGALLLLKLRALGR